MNLKEAIKVARSVKPHHAQTFARTVVPEVVRPARVIWNQAVGGIFLLFAFSATFKALQLFRDGLNDGRSIFFFVISVIFSAVMIGFGIDSLRKAKRIGSRP